MDNCTCGGYEDGMHSRHCERRQWIEQPRMLQFYRKLALELYANPGARISDVLTRKDFDTIKEDLT